MSSYIHGSNPEEQKRLSLLNELINERCIQLLGLEGDEKIIDMGSGLGQFTLAMARKIGAKGKCLGIERDSHQLETANNNLAKQGDISWVEFRQGDAENMPLKKEEWNSFDVGHARYILEHLSKPETALKELVKAVRPGGRVVIEDDDHVGLLLYPEPAGFSSLWTAYMRSYDRLGNDPYIGRRLVSMMYDTGLREIRNDVVFFGDCAGSATFKGYVANLVGVIETARNVMTEGNLISKKVMDESMKNLREWADLPYAALWYQIYWAVGFKPSPTAI
jgi:ubiquinone/menaquinone biosynthesis C-methylase UbiE